MKEMISLTLKLYLKKKLEKLKLPKLKKMLNGTRKKKHMILKLLSSKKSKILFKVDYLLLSYKKITETSLCRLLSI
jgi:uncharacterized protein YccT (UPF0319 family)